MQSVVCRIVLPFVQLSAAAEVMVAGALVIDGTVEVDSGWDVEIVVPGRVEEVATVVPSDIVVLAAGNAAMRRGKERSRVAAAEARIVILLLGLEINIEKV